MFAKVLTAVAIAALAYVGYLMVRAYRPQWFKAEPFKVKRRVIDPVIAAPAPVIKMDPPPAEKTVTAGGPNTPNARPPPTATMSPEAAPTDPYDSTHMETPVKDTLTYPELSFGPGVNNTVAKTGSTSSVSSSKFSPEFAQNGGSFMGSVFANDIQTGDDYADA